MTDKKHDHGHDNDHGHDHKHKHDHDHSHGSHVDEIDCLQAIELLYAYLDGELDNIELEQFEHHLGHCKSCYSRSELETALNKRIKESSAEKVPETLQNRLKDIIDKI